MVIAEEVKEFLQIFHHSVEKGAHAGINTMMNKISMLKYQFVKCNLITVYRFILLLTWSNRIDSQNYQRM